MRIAVVGAGAIGGFLGGWLSAAGEDVTFIARGANLDAIAKNGMGVEMGGGLGALAGKVWRVGVMGHNAQPDRVTRFVGALEEALKAEGWRG